MRKFWGRIVDMVVAGTLAASGLTCIAEGISPSRETGIIFLVVGCAWLVVLAGRAIRDMWRGPPSDAK